MVGYADDWVIYSSSESHGDAVDRVRNCVNRVDHNGLCKTVLRYLPKKLSTSASTEKVNKVTKNSIKIRGTSIDNVDHHKILGLTFDKRLNWKQHLKTTKQKAEKRINIIKCLTKTHWGADHDVLLNVHKAVVLGTLRYGEQVYGSASKSLLDKLEATHNKGLRAALGVFCITKTNKLLEEAGQPTLEKMRENSTIKKSRKFNPNADTPSLQPLMRRTAKFFHDHQMEIQRVEKSPKNEVPPWNNSIPSFINLQMMTVREEAPPTKQARFKELTNNNNIKVFTDGSKTTESCGYAIVHDNETVASRRLHNISSIYTAEVRAITQAAKLFKSSHTPIEICTDSLSSITATQNNAIKKPTVRC
jgi:hypothetical protein